MRGLLLRLGIIGAIGVGAFVLRPFLMGDAGSLAVGDCFDPPAGGPQEVEQVQHHPCTDAHLAEVIYVADYAAADATYPSEDSFRAFVLDRCIPAFNSYTGLDYNAATDLDVGPMWPTAEGWGDGDREVTCFALKVDGSTVTGSIKKQ
jgi:hypothetical protein